MFYIFCLFTPLFRRFRLSRVSHAQDLDEIYRLVSKILNFMPCGLVFGGFCVFYCENRFPKIKFAIEPCRREVLGRPVARYSAVFVFLSCARVLCAGLVRFSCAPSCAPKANYSTKHRRFIAIFANTSDMRTSRQNISPDMRKSSQNNVGYSVLGNDYTINSKASPLV